MARHVTSFLIGTAGVAAAAALSQMEAPTWLLWVTVVAFLLAAALIELPAGKRVKLWGLIGIAAVYLVCVAIVYWPSEPEQRTTNEQA